MTVSFERNGKKYAAALDKCLDISLKLNPDKWGANAFYAPAFQAEPVVHGNFIGSTKKGGAVNFLNLKLNPHGNGTHTECVGHIAQEAVTINDTLRTFHFPAELISVYPEKQDNGDRVVTKLQLEQAIRYRGVAEALIVRTLPNDSDKKNRNYSGTNPPYFDVSAIEFILDQGFKHLLIDLPSVDREEDEGKLASHKAFWNYPNEISNGRTITELIFANNEIKDDLYLLLLQIGPFEIDVSPSKPVLFEVNEEK